VLINTESKRLIPKLNNRFRIPLSNFLYGAFEVIEGKPFDFSKSDMHSFFPTLYAHTKPEEMYAEMFSFWLTAGLKEPAKSWFESIHA
jgi:hypothetical protein